MVISNEQQIRIWIDAILQLTRDGLKKPILIAYKNRFPNNYMAEIQEKINKHGQYTADIFASDDLLLTKVDDPRSWLDLMSRRWDALFDKKSGSTGKNHVETLREIRDKWAHNRPLTLQDAYSAAERSINLLKDFQCESVMEDIRQIFTELDALKVREQGTISVVEQSLPLQLLTSPASGFMIEEAAPSDGDTERIEIRVDDGEFYVEIVEHDGNSRHQKVPIHLGRVIIGRSANAHIGLSDARVSRTHLMLLKNDTGLILTDLRSANGAQLEGKRVNPNEPTHWAVGQVVTVGNTWLILRRGI